jgi:hypothetical protein
MHGCLTELKEIIALASGRECEVAQKQRVFFDYIAQPHEAVIRPKLSLIHAQKNIAVFDCHVHNFAIP